MKRLLLFFSLVCLLPEFSEADEAGPLAVIVANTQAGRVSGLVDLSLIYRRKKLVWINGERLRPINLPPDHALRRIFSQQVLGSSPEGLASYWNAMYFQGVSPPHVLASEEAVLRFVTDTPGAIGYVSACKADARVKPIFWLMPEGTSTTQQPALKCGQD